MYYHDDMNDVPDPSVGRIVRAGLGMLFGDPGAHFDPPTEEEN